MGVDVLGLILPWMCHRHSVDISCEINSSLILNCSTNAKEHISMYLMASTGNLFEANSHKSELPFYGKC